MVCVADSRTQSASTFNCYELLRYVRSETYGCNCVEFLVNGSYG